MLIGDGDPPRQTIYSVDYRDRTGGGWRIGIYCERCTHGLAFQFYPYPSAEIQKFVPPQFTTFSLDNTMVGSTLLQALPTAFLLAATVSATPYAQQYGRQSNYNWPSQVAGEAHDPSWPQFVNKTIRWSTYEPPSFNEVFLPKTEKDLSIGVSPALTCYILKGFRLTG